MLRLKDQVEELLKQRELERAEFARLNAIFTGIGWPFKLGDRVRKKSGGSWQGIVVGAYSTARTPTGIAVESEREVGNVQIYPAAAFELVPVPKPEPAPLTPSRRPTLRPTTRQPLPTLLRPMPGRMLHLRRPTSPAVVSAAAGPSARSTAASRCRPRMPGAMWLTPRRTLQSTSRATRRSCARRAVATATTT
jgi:hypothetical protein